MKPQTEKLRILTVAVFALTIMFIPFRAHAIPLLPVHYESDFCKVRPGTYPSRLLIKEFKAVDKGTSVETGLPTGSVYEIFYNNRHQAHRYREYNLNGDLNEQYDITFNENGLMKTEQKKGANRLVQLSNEYVYKNPAKENTLSQQKIYNPDKKLMYVETYNRDKNGNISSLQRTTESGKVVFAYEYTYDERHNVEREIRTNAAGDKISEDEYEYNEHNLLASETGYDSKGKMVSRTEYEYNDKGIIISAVTTVPDGPSTVYKFKYEYDAQGNWVKQIMYKGADIPVSVMIRTIEYF